MKLEMYKQTLNNLPNSSVQLETDKRALEAEIGNLTFERDVIHQALALVNKGTPTCMSE
ncbi:MAG: hypothetical protein WDZ91_08970 [Paenibacillaceae bacterium]